MIIAGYVVFYSVVLLRCKKELRMGICDLWKESFIEYCNELVLVAVQIS